MTPKKPSPFLSLVKPQPDLPSVRADDFAPATWQSTLFAQSNPGLLVFIDFERVTEQDFITVLAAAKLRYVIDLRSVPRFNVGSLNRKVVFSHFAQSQTRYVDVHARLGITDRRDARLNPQIIYSHLESLLSPGSENLEGPIGFLVDKEQFDDTYIELLLQSLPRANGDAWEVLKIPYVSATEVEGEVANPRKLIFISHATPEDNQFVSWLGVQLACSGYEVWSDVTKLVGGELFWDDIEEAIRKSSARVVVVLSRIAQTKKGVLDEVNCAISVERSQKLDGFVVPIRVDDLPFDEVRANLARKNIIDFRGNWADGLLKLLRSFEKDRVPRALPSGPDAAALWYSRRQEEADSLVEKSEILLTNWLPILALPEHLLFHDINVPVGQAEKLTQALAYPAFRYFRLTATFAGAFDFQNDLPPPTAFSEKYRVKLEKFLNGTASEIPGLSAKDAHNQCVNLLRQGWDLFAQQKGLLPYKTASGAIGWFLANDKIAGNRISFIDLDGKRRRKSVVGWSERRKLYWHLAVELKPAFGLVPRMVARSHVVFTEDGVKPIDSKERMHVMRRRFCKSWWNDRWRDLLLAYVSWLADENGEINVPLGEGVFMRLAGRPMELKAPVSIKDEEFEGEEVRDDLVDELDLTDLDDEEDWSDDLGAEEELADEGSDK